MPDWSLSLAVLILGLIGLVLGSAGVQGAIGASGCRFSPWQALVAMLPAMAVTLQAIGSDASTLGLGAIIGVHVLGVLLAIRRFSSRLRAWSLIGAAIGVWGLGFDGRLGRVDGGVLVLLCLLYLAWMTRAARQSASPRDDGKTQAAAVDAGQPTRLVRSRWRIWVVISRFCLGLILLAVGARVLAMGALDLALVLDLDDWTLGLMLVAPVGVLAGWAPILLARPRPDEGASRLIAPGFAVDFNLVNLLGLVGLTALTAPGGLPFTRETLLVSWLLVILTSILAAAALIRAEPA
ncbi:hypothetical protein HW932_07010 [Allochromatium humboldtianum]|uniref:Uncharacterized protein n=1 Tax=Allochromatium humboldtianum TaxID=504901 RepID=A0A850R6Q6_9GAMM|nr:hypothetical protein [Allochromatium humboldtianum]NVZ09008.1 hypothetical protein [Allochromatium humboldtianum]